MRSGLGFFVEFLECTAVHVGTSPCEIAAQRANLHGGQHASVQGQVGSRMQGPGARI